MPEATIPVADAKALIALFGARDQHLRRIREALGVAISSRNDRIIIEGADKTVAQATEVFEQMRGLVSRQGIVSTEDVDHLLTRVAGHGPVDAAPIIELRHAGRSVRPRTPGQARYVERDRRA